MSRQIVADRVVSTLPASGILAVQVGSVVSNVLTLDIATSQLRYQLPTGAVAHAFRDGAVVIGDSAPGGLALLRVGGQVAVSSRVTVGNGFPSALLTAADALVVDGDLHLRGGMRVRRTSDNETVLHVTATGAAVAGGLSIGRTVSQGVPNGGTPQIALDFKTAVNVTLAHGQVLTLTESVPNEYELTVVDLFGYSAKFIGGYSSVSMTAAASDSATLFSTVAGTSGRTNVYADTGDGNRMKLQNLTGGNRPYRLTLVRW